MIEPLLARRERRMLGWWRVAMLLAAGLLTGAGHVLLARLSSRNGIDITAAIWFHAGRLPPMRTLGRAVLSVLVVGMGASLLVAVHAR